jgi:exonuclease III
MPNQDPINNLKRHKTSESNLNIVQFNCNGISNKISEIRMYIYTTKPDIVCLCETWIKEMNPNLLDTIVSGNIEWWKEED